MFYSHYMTTYVSRTTRRRSTSVNVFLTAAEKAALDEGGTPDAAQRYVITVYDKEKSEYALRRSHPSEMNGVRLRPVPALLQRVEKFKGLYLAAYSADGYLGGTPPYLWRIMDARGVRVVKVLGIPHLVFRLPTQTEAEPPRGAIQNRKYEPFYRPEDHPPGAVRRATVVVQQPQANNGAAAAAQPAAVQPATDPASIPAPSMPKDTGRMLSALDRLKLSLSNINLLAPKLGAKLSVGNDGKLHAKIVTEVDL